MNWFVNKYYCHNLFCLPFSPSASRLTSKTTTGLINSPLKYVVNNFYYYYDLFLSAILSLWLSQGLKRWPLREESSLPRATGWVLGHVTTCLMSHAASLRCGAVWYGAVRHHSCAVCTLGVIVCRHAPSMLKAGKNTPEFPTHHINTWQNPYISQQLDTDTSLHRENDRYKKKKIHHCTEKMTVTIKKRHKPWTHFYKGYFTCACTGLCLLSSSDYPFIFCVCFYLCAGVCTCCLGGPQQMIFLEVTLTASPW